MKKLLILILILFVSPSSIVQAQNLEQISAKQQVDGYRGIWFELGQVTEYGDKYSGGLGTYTAKHTPLAIYAEEVDKTFFVYGGTTGERDKYLLCMIGVFDHATNQLSKPTIVYDKRGVKDPHDNPSISIDPQGYIWVFVSGRNVRRPGLKFKSKDPYNIEFFEQVSEEEFTYPQPWYLSNNGFFHFFTKYTGFRELYFETSADGMTWSEDKKLAGIKRESDDRAGHYQVSNHFQNKLVTFMNWHPNGNVDQRTNLYYLESSDFGNTWTTADGEVIDIPLTDVNSATLVKDYFSENKNVYLKDVNFDAQGNPICLYLTSLGHTPGPQNGPREWRIAYWNGGELEDHLITTSDHNYDMGSLFIDDSGWKLVAPTMDGPQQWGGGGEIVIFNSTDQGKTWNRSLQVTQNSSRNHNYIRRVVNGKPPFEYFWADGNPEEFSISKLYIGDLAGTVIELPYDMEEETTTLMLEK